MYGCFLRCVAAITLAAAAPAAATDLPAALEKQIDRRLTNAVATHEVAGAVVLVSRGGRPQFSRAYGMAEIEQKARATPDTVFRVGSIAKQFTATAALKLEEEGRLQLDHKLARYLPDFPRADEITLRQLLGHTGGLRNYNGRRGAGEAPLRLDRTTAEMVAYIKALDPLFESSPGTAWSYSNSGFYLVQAVIEQITGESLARYLERTFFKPLNLRSMALDDPADIVPGRAHGYDRAPSRPAKFTNTRFVSMTAAGGAGALRATAADLAAWHHALLANRVLSAASLEALLAPVRLADGQVASTGELFKAWERPAYGLGMATGSIAGRRIVGHGGSINGFNAALYSFPESATTVVILTNTGGGTERLAPELLQAVAAWLPR